MKRIIVKHLFSVLLVFICTATYAQKNPFDKFADSENLKYVYVSKQMIGLVKDLPLTNVVSITNYHNIDELCSIQIISSGKGSIGELKSEAWSIKEGLELAQQRIPDIILSDVMMPVMDGF